MSRIGKKPIEIPAGVTVTMAEGIITATGSKGTLSRQVPQEVAITQENNVLSVAPVTNDNRGRAMHGLVRTLVANMVTGVSGGFEKGLEIVGVGYRGEVEGNVLRLHIGYSRPIEYQVVDGISITIEKQVNLKVSGIDKELVGKVAAEIRDFKRPEPYKGKGIRYAGEHVRRKVGKSAGS